MVLILIPYLIMSIKGLVMYRNIVEKELKSYCDVRCL